MKLNNIDKISRDQFLALPQIGPMRIIGTYATSFKEIEDDAHITDSDYRFCDMFLFLLFIA